MEGKRYPSDMTDDEWAILEPLIPSSKPGGRPRSADMREVTNAIFYVLRGGIPWRFLPKEFPPWKTVYHYFRRWRLDGTWEMLNTNRTYAVEGIFESASPNSQLGNLYSTA